MKKITAMALTLGMSLLIASAAYAEAAKKPVIGISWRSNTYNYEGFKKVIEEAGGIPVVLNQVTSKAVKYDNAGKILGKELEASGMLKQRYADKIKAKKFAKTNVEETLKGVDAVFMIGGEDISPSLFKVPQKEANHGEEINATRDVSDYTLMAYCIEKDFPIFAVCRGMQMMGIVSGVTFIQDIPDYYKAKKVDFPEIHRMPPGTPNRTYARHDVELMGKDSHLFEIVKAGTITNVSSWHHQAVDSLEGTGLVQTAKAVYGGVEIMEGLENPNKKYCVAVQFHPENDVKLVAYDKKTTPADYETALSFFKNLVKYASK